MTNYHEPVMLVEVIKALHIKNQARIIDATLGTGGHTLEIIKKGACVLGIEADKNTLTIANKRLEAAFQDLDLGKQACPSPFDKGECFKAVNGNFSDIDKIAGKEGFTQADGVLFDLGVNNLQLTSKTLGMSFAIPDTTLDMRLDPDTQGVLAADLLNSLPEVELRKLFGKILGVPESKRLAKKVVAKRIGNKFTTVGDFLSIIERNSKKIHPATKAFLALRIAVNSELENLEVALPKAFHLLESGGRLVVISFHSAEDRIVKKFAKGATAKVITKKPLVPSEGEVAKNPKARSAKLRVIEKI